MSDSQAQKWACCGAGEDDIDEDESAFISTSKVSSSKAVNALNTALIFCWYVN